MMKMATAGVLLALHPIAGVATGQVPLSIEGGQSSVERYAELELCMRMDDRSTADLRAGRAELRASFQSPRGRCVSSPAFLLQRYQRQDPTDLRSGRAGRC